MFSNFKFTYILVLILLSKFCYAIPPARTPSTTTAKRIQTTLNTDNSMENDLNIIANKIDEIPDTNMNLQLVFLGFNCRDVIISWNINEGEKTLYAARTNSTVFGFQIVVREYLLAGNTQQKPETHKAVRLYTSKYIDVNHNKFKLTNLLYNNIANYVICLVIYFDVIETIAFEKECINFNLPVSLYENNRYCDRNGFNQQANNNQPLGTLPTTTEITRITHTIFQTTTSAASTKKGATTSSTAKGATTSRRDHDYYDYYGGKERSGTEQEPSVDHDTLMNIVKNCMDPVECKHYSNLLVAFVVCVILLVANIFMFTLIIAQNYVRLKYYGKNGNDVGYHAYGNQQNGTRKSGNNLNRTNNGFDLLRCCSKPPKPPPRSKSENNREESDSGCLGNVSCCPTIKPDRKYSESYESNLKVNKNLNNQFTRPGYILQAPSSSSLGSSTLTNARSKRKSSVATTQNRIQDSVKTRSRDSIMTTSQHGGQPSMDSQKYQYSYRASTFSDNFQFYDDSFDREIFYHVQAPPRKQLCSQTSSAF